MRTGKDIAEAVEKAIDQLLKQDSKFVAEIEEGHTAARCGDLTDHYDAVNRIEQMFRP